MMSREQKIRLISAYNYYKTMVEFYGLQHLKTRAALVTLVKCYRTKSEEFNQDLTLIKGLESEFDGETMTWEDM